MFISIHILFMLISSLYAEGCPMGGDALRGAGFGRRRVRRDRVRSDESTCGDSVFVRNSRD
jgi:hypothetical protein